MFKIKALKLGKIGNHEYGIANLFMALTTIIVLASWLTYASAVAPLIAQMILAIIIVGSLLILGLAVWERIKKVEPGKKYEDERADVCSLKATRNAFMIALLFIVFVMIIGDVSSSSVTGIRALGPLLAIWGVSVAAYTISWHYYIGAD